MKIATWNVNGIRARQAQLEEWLERERPHVVCLQEIKASFEQVPAALIDLPNYWAYWHGAKGYSGVALLVSRDAYPDEPVFSHPEFDHENRIVVGDLGDVAVVSVYVPNGGKDFAAKMRFLHALEAYVTAFAASGKSLVVCGDINVARADIDVHPKERKLEIIGQLPDERVLIDRMVSAGLRDIVRDLHPDDDQFFTWWAPWRNMRQRNIGWRIDYIFASGPIAGQARSIVSQRELGTSDHAPLVAEFGVGVATTECR